MTRLSANKDRAMYGRGQRAPVDGDVVTTASELGIAATCVADGRMGGFAASPGRRRADGTV